MTRERESNDFEQLFNQQPQERNSEQFRMLLQTIGSSEAALLIALTLAANPGSEFNRESLAEILPFVNPERAMQEIEGPFIYRGIAYESGEGSRITQNQYIQLNVLSAGIQFLAFAVDQSTKPLEYYAKNPQLLSPVEDESESDIPSDIRRLRTIQDYWLKAEVFPESTSAYRKIVLDFLADPRIAAVMGKVHEAQWKNEQVIKNEILYFLLSTDKESSSVEDLAKSIHLPADFIAQLMPSIVFSSGLITAEITDGHLSYAGNKRKAIDMVLVNGGVVEVEFNSQNGTASNFAIKNIGRPYFFQDEILRGHLEDDFVLLMQGEKRAELQKIHLLVYGTKQKAEIPRPKIVIKKQPQDQADIKNISGLVYRPLLEGVVNAIKLGESSFEYTDSLPVIDYPEEKAPMDDMEDKIRQLNPFVMEGTFLSTKRDWIYASLMRDTRGEIQSADIDDLTQDIMLTILYKCANKVMEKGAGGFVEYLKLVKLSKLVDYLRSRHRINVLDEVTADRFMQPTISPEQYVIAQYEDRISFFNTIERISQILMSMTKVQGKRAKVMWAYADNYGKKYFTSENVRQHFGPNYRIGTVKVQAMLARRNIEENLPESMKNIGKGRHFKGGRKEPNSEN